MSNPNAKNSIDRTESFVQHLTGCQTRLYAYILMLLPNHDDAADVLQETNLVLWRKADEFTEGTEFGAWACRIAHFQVLAWFRDAKRDRLVFDPELLGLMASQACTLSAEMDDRRRVLRMCMTRLTEREREMLGRRYDLGRSVKEIATELGQSPGAVATSLYRIRNELLLCVQDRLPDGEKDRP
jgi:RNA polymerase sigma-70 factor (ECF subfamily)